MSCGPYGPIFNQEIQTCFGLVKIILNSITAQFMADIGSLWPPKSDYMTQSTPWQWGPFLRAKKSILDLKLFCIIYCIFDRAFDWAFHPLNIHSVSRHCNIAPDQVFDWQY